MQLVDSLRLLVMLPADSDSWSVDDRDDFKRFRYSVGLGLGLGLGLGFGFGRTLTPTLTRFRYSVGDVLSDACKVLGSVQCLERVFTVLQAREI